MSHPKESVLPRLVLDTNVFIAAAYNPHSARARIVDLARRQRLTLIISPAIRREYERLFPKAVRSEERRDWIWETSRPGRERHAGGDADGDGRPG